MSYAGPVSRAKRAPGPSGATTKSRPPARRAPSQTDDHRPTLVFAAGIVVGLAVGAGVALLLAPQAGADTRRTLGRQTRRIGQRGHDAWDDLRDEFRRALRQRRRARQRDREQSERVLVAD
jgi:hypothetical protein